MRHSSESSKKNPYEVESVARACRLLSILHEGKSLRLFELAARSTLSRPTTLRLLATLQSNGFIVKNTANEYQVIGRSAVGKQYRIGYAAQTSEFAFSRMVTRGLVESAKKASIDLVVLDNDYSPITAVANADKLLAEKIDLIMEFQTDAQVAPLISARASQRKVPMIAIEIPHPGATYFGVNNCQAGLVAGRYLGRWAEQHWKGQVDEVLLIGLPQAGSLPEARLTGSLLGIREVLPNLMESRITVISGNGQLDGTRAAVKRHLNKTTSKRILVSAINDPSALGALEAFRHAGRLAHCAIMGQNGSVEARVELRKGNSRLVGSVGYFPEKYGEQLVSLALEMLAQKNAAPHAVFIKHQLLTSKTLKQHYKGETRIADPA